MNFFNVFKLRCELIKARAQIGSLSQQVKDLTMTRDELLQKIEGVRQQAVALRTDRDQLAAQVATLTAQQDLADIGTAVDGIGTALQPVPGPPTEAPPQ